MAPIHKILLTIMIAMAFRSFRQYLAGCVCNLEGRLDNKVALVLAADTDIGVATVRGLARRGAHVVMACQVVERCNKVKQLLVQEFSNEKGAGVSVEKVGDNKLREDMIKSVSSIRADQLSIRQVHLASAAEIKKFCVAFKAEFKKLNILIVNAVHFSATYDRTVDGFERNMGMNYIASYLITQHLLPLMEQSAKPDFLSRIVFVSSKLHKYGELPKSLSRGRVNKNDYSWWKSYSSSHLALVTYANYLSTKVRPSKMRVISVHPGFENRHFGSILKEPFAYLATWAGKSAWQSAQTTLYVTLMRPGEPGVYFEDCLSAQPHPLTFNTNAAKELIMMTNTEVMAYLSDDIPLQKKLND
ncbi:unnamed protein product [Rodentolepis nana]|uniref:Retinol dehydrogenase 12-like n=1 Tax=Rodentolepis nana TaxID=102285 RepID=A0A0R3TQG1_RODNA|nr:unnamed protein product [Rodentolepis nana]